MNECLSDPKVVVVSRIFTHAGVCEQGCNRGCIGQSGRFRRGPLVWVCFHNPCQPRQCPARLCLFQPHDSALGLVHFNDFLQDWPREMPHYLQFTKNLTDLGFKGPPLNYPKLFLASVLRAPQLPVVVKSLCPNHDSEMLDQVVAVCEKYRGVAIKSRSLLEFFPPPGEMTKVRPATPPSAQQVAFTPPPRDTHVRMQEKEITMNCKLIPWNHAPAHAGTLLSHFERCGNVRPYMTTRHALWDCVIGTMVPNPPENHTMMGRKREALQKYWRDHGSLEGTGVQELSEVFSPHNTNWV